MTTPAMDHELRHGYLKPIWRLPLFACLLFKLAQAGAGRESRLSICLHQSKGIILVVISDILCPTHCLAIKYFLVRLRLCRCLISLHFSGLIDVPLCALEAQWAGGFLAACRALARPGSADASAASFPSRGSSVSPIEWGRSSLNSFGFGFSFS